MTTSLALGLLLAVVSSALLNFGFFEQQRSATALPAVGLREPRRWLSQLFHDRRWVAGFAIGCGGWALYICALALAPLSLVQALSAAGIVVLAALALRDGALAPTTANLMTVGIAAAGMAALGLSLAGEVGSGKADPARLMGWVAASALAATAAALAGRSHLLVPGAALGMCAGVLYAVGDVITKAVVSGSVPVGLALLVLLSHGLAFVALQVAFRQGGPMATVGCATLLTNAVPIVAGLVVFAEPFPGGAAGIARLVGFAATVAAAALLAGGGVWDLRFPRASRSALRHPRQPAGPRGGAG